MNLPTGYDSPADTKTPLPAGLYQAQLDYMYFSKADKYMTPYAYQEVQFKWLIYPGQEVDEELLEVMKEEESLDDQGLYGYSDRFTELDLKPETYDERTKRTYKASPFVRKLNALIAPKTFTAESTIDWHPSQKFTELGDFPIYKELTLAENKAFEEANGAKPQGKDLFKDTGRTQTIYEGVMKDALVDGASLQNKWVSIKLGLNQRGYNTIGTNDVNPLSAMERNFLKSAGFIKGGAIERPR